ncbi:MULTISPECIES: CHAT domain-containing protein [Amycolatopsis]|uniref:CHAT domain-containing protein n=1 Tax=Amycolatopsis bullii TaxID=941987 RepID=A0ABQ3K8C4_9PSEU|nr:CHAT domain-containing tetratricopeptide repeat protein [Amycolatopsis bullii]GHG02457.1 CHAT domain-containing protein [Amycolatopsis bullii]
MFGRQRRQADDDFVSGALWEGKAWLDAFESSGDLAALEQAIAAGTAAFERGDPAAPERSATLMFLGDARLRRHQATGSVPDLDQALAHYRELLPLVRAEQPDLVPFSLAAIAESALRLGVLTGDRSRAEESVLATRELHLLAGSTGAVHLFALVIELLERALVALPGDHPDRAAIGALRCTALVHHIEGTGDPALLGEAEEEIDRALRLCPPDDGNRRPFLTVAADVRRLRHDLEGTRATLDAFLDAERHVLDVHPPGHPVWTITVHNLGRLYRERHESTGDVADLDTAAHYLRQAIEHAPDADLRAAAERGLADVLEARGPVQEYEPPPGVTLEYVAGPEDPRRPLAEAAGDPAELVRHGNRLSRLLGQYQQSRDHTFLDRICADGEALLAALPAKHPRRWLIEIRLGPALMLRYELTGDRADLDAAIDLQRAAIGRPVDGPADLLDEFGNLAAALVNRFLRDRDSADLDEAIALARRGVELDEAHATTSSAILGSALFYRYSHLGRRHDLDEAIAVGERTVATAGPLRIANARAGLGNRLRQRFLATGDPADIDAAVEHLEAALRREEDVHTRLNLGLALSDRGQTRAERQDLLDAVTAFTTVRAATGEQAPLHTIAVQGLGEAYLALGRPDDAIAVLSALPEGRSFDRMRVLVTLAGLRADRGDDAGAVADLYEQAVALLPVLVWRGLSATDRGRLVSQWPGLAGDAAAAALAAGRPERAVELLEHGRSLWWSQVLDRRTDLTGLRAAHPELAARLSAVDLDAPDRRAAAAEWDAAVAEVRTRPGFENFLRPTPFAELAKVAAAGPVVLVNVSRIRCDAIVLAPDRGHVIPLAGLTHAEAQDRTRAYLAATAKKGTGGLSSGPREQLLLGYLEWLWDTVARPVLDEAAVPPGSRLWWCPTGPLAPSPLHAAGYHDPDDPPGRSVLDRVISSSTPTIRALSHARRPARPVRHRPLAVVCEQRPAYVTGLPDLPAAVREAEVLAGLFPGGTTLAGAAATTSAVTDLLTGHSCAHFACHGGTAPDGEAALFLVDGPLTTTDLSRLDLPDAHLAVLSACHTAMPDAATPDEAGHLAAALQVAGFRQVVSTLWAIGEETAAAVTASLYGSLAAPDGTLDPAGAAAALRTAVKELRDRSPYEPSKWAQFVHFGQ